MAFEVEQIVGPSTRADGLTDGPFRISRLGSLTVTDAHGHYYEASARQKLFTAFLAQGTTTVAAGNIVGAAAAASTQFAVWNPLNSGVNMSLQKLIITQYSGTPTAGGLFHSTFNAASVASTLATAGAVRNNYVNGPSGAGLCLASAAGSALTGGLILTTLGASNLSSTATAQATPAGLVMSDLIDGMITIPPGFGYVPTWSGAGTTYLVGYSLTWEEVAV
jgi:hypothetical protein